MTRKGYLKVLCIILSVLMLSALMTSCGQGDVPDSASADSTQPKVTDKGEAPVESASEPSPELKFWVFQKDAAFDFLSGLSKRYNNANNASINVKTENIPSDQYNGTKLTTAFATNAGPDIFLASPGTMSKYISSEVALDLTGYFSDTALKDFNPSAIDGVTVDGKIYAIPMEIDLYALYYDIEALEKANVNPPKTWDELKAAALKLKTETRTGVTFEVVKGAYQTCSWYPFMWMSGGDIFTADKKDSAVNSEGVIKGLKFWRDLIESGAANVKPSRSTGDIGILCEGETAMQICGTWAIATAGNKYPDKKIGVVPLPVPEGGTAASVAGGWKLMVNAAGSDPDSAAKFIEWAFAEDLDIPLEWCTQVKFCYSPRKSVVEAGKDVYSVGLRKVFTDEIYGTEKPEIRMPAEAGSIIQDMVQQGVLDSKISVEEVVKKTDEKLKEFLKEYEGSI